jgi:Chlorophyll A-B binding protein
MKLSCAIILASISSTTAFVAPKSAISSVSCLSMSDEAMPVVTEQEQPEPPQLPKMSQSLPFMERPAALDGSLAGDVGFDPVGFSKSKDDLMRYREAEIKHGVS